MTPIGPLLGRPGSHGAPGTRAGLVRTTAALYVVQIAGYLLPLASIPYLFRTLGPTQFGLYGFVLAISRYLLLVTDYGFSYSATRHLAARHSRGEPIDRAYSAVSAARCVLLAGSAIVLLAATLAVPTMRENAGLYWLAFAGVAGSAFAPPWLFQALERLPLYSAAALISRVVTTALIFVLVHEPSDLAVVLALWSAGWIATAAIALVAAHRSLGVRLVRVAPADVREELRDGLLMFLSGVGASFATTSNAVILGFIAGNRAVGYYVAAERIITAVVGLLGPPTQALYPRAAVIASESRARAVSYARRAIVPIGSLGFVTGLSTALMAPILGPALFGPEFEESVRILQILSVIPFAVSLANVLGIQLMLPLRMDRAYTLCVVAMAVANIALALALTPAHGGVGTAIAASGAETLFVAMALGSLWAAGRRRTGVLAERTGAKEAA